MTSSRCQYSSRRVVTIQTSPPPAPTRRDVPGFIKGAEAVMATRPANIPLMTEMASGRPVVRQAYTNAVMPAAELANVVLTKTRGRLWESGVLLPPLKPNHPTDNKNSPNAERGRLCPLMVPPCIVNRPCRGPMTRMAANATHPAVECTTVAPAKSRNPICWSQPEGCPSELPPQIQ